MDDTSDFREWATGARARLRRTAYLLSGDWHLAEDLTQETLLRMYAAWGRPHSVDSYARITLVNLYRALLRRCLNTLRPMLTLGPLSLRRHAAWLLALEAAARDLADATVDARRCPHHLRLGHVDGEGE